MRRGEAVSIIFAFMLRPFISVAKTLRLRPTYPVSSSNVQQDEKTVARIECEATRLLLGDYDPSCQADSGSLAISKKLEHAQYFIWLAISHLNNKRSNCASPLPLNLYEVAYD